ncbi:MAG: ABC-F family ATPase [Acidiferrobacterales bacterium]|nr:ABC-F family ATPase [Acidiferrobacterales bacterium]
MISTANITMQFGDKPLFEDISVNFGDGNRYGLIGANGSGKSTFMKILDGSLEPTNGNISVTPNERIGKLNQDQFAYEDDSVIDTVIMGYAELWEVKQERDRIYSLAEMSEEEGIKVAELEVQFAEMDGYTAEARAGELLMGVGIPIVQHMGPMSKVAPGWKLRVLLAQALFSDPDILLLDEPTNNLDIHTIRWLEKILKERRSTMVIISHDRHFLNSVCTHMADLDYGDIKLFPGNYDEYMTAATMVRERMQAENAKKKAQIAELKTFVSRFSANASKAKQATSRAKLIDKIQLDEIKPSSRVNPFIRFKQDKKLYRNAIEVEGLSMAYDEELFTNQSFSIEVGERLAIIGQNGAGKTTLIENMLHQIVPLEGEDPIPGAAPTAGKVKWSENAEIGYYAQDHADDFEQDMTVYDWMYQWRKDKEDEQFVRGVLGQLLFSKDDIKKSVKVLSGGEKGRMLFGKIMMQRPNIIIMDEPTNHLDMESIESLNLALENYEGTLIFVSHDREFVSSLATQIFEIEDTRIEHFVGSYDDYLAKKDAIAA